MAKLKKAQKIISILTCPKCGHKQEGEIPLDACIPFYECKSCGQVISAEKSCCVFCDYGDKPCPVGAHK